MRARTYAERAKAIYEELEARAEVGRLLNNLGGLNYLLGKPDAAMDYLKDAFRVLIDAGIVSLGINPYYSSVVQGGLLIIAVSLDQVAHIQRERYQKAMAMREQSRLLDEQRRKAPGSPAQSA